MWNFHSGSIPLPRMLRLAAAGLAPDSVTATPWHAGVESLPLRLSRIVPAELRLSHYQPTRGREGSSARMVERGFGCRSLTRILRSWRDQLP